MLYHVSILGVDGVDCFVDLAVLPLPDGLHGNQVTSADLLCKEGTLDCLPRRSFCRRLLFTQRVILHVSAHGAAQRVSV